MKKQLAALIFLCFSLPSFAQRFEIGSGVGISYTKPLSGWATEHPYFSDEKTVGGLTGQLQLIEFAMNIRRYKFGAVLSSTALLYYYGRYETNSTGQRIFAKNMSDVIAGFPVSIFADRVFSIRKLQLYGGLCAGLLNNRNENRSAWSIGIQAGGTWWFTKHWGFNLNAIANYYHVHYWGYVPDEPVHLTTYATALNIPITLGIHYRF